MKFILKKPKQDKKNHHRINTCKIKTDGDLTRIKLVKKTSCDMHSSKLCMLANIYFILNTFLFPLNGIHSATFAIIAEEALRDSNLLLTNIKIIAGTFTSPLYKKRTNTILEGTVSMKGGSESRAVICLLPSSTPTVKF